jgi:hypothetical protein
VSGSAEQKTVKRSYTPRNYARAVARTHASATGGDTSEFGRPANVPCSMYTTWLRQLRHNFALFASHYAPSVGAEWLHKEDRGNALLLVPLAQSHAGPCAMVNLQRGEHVFGAERAKRMTGELQGELLLSLYLPSLLPLSPCPPASRYSL